MLFYRHLAGNDIDFFYFPLTNDIDFREICYNYNYQKNSKTGNPFYPNDDYFILKYVGSTFAIKVQYSGSSNYYESTPLFNNKELIINAEISNDYSYKIDYILGSNENCAVEVKQKYNNSYILLGKLSENNNRLILPVQNLILISKNFHAVVTIVSNKNLYKSYYVDEQNVIMAKLEPTGFTLFKIPEKETNLRVFKFDVKAGYRIGNDYYPCRILNAGMILIHGLFIEEPYNHIAIYKQGDDRYLYFFNPYYFENSNNKFKDDEYYIAFTCNCYFAKNSPYLRLQYSLYPSKFDLKETEYKVNNKIHEIGKAFEPLVNFYQIDPPENDNVILTISSTSCSSNTFNIVVLSDSAKIIYKAKRYQDSVKRLENVFFVFRDDEKNLEAIIHADTALWNEEQQNWDLENTFQYENVNGTLVLGPVDEKYKSQLTEKYEIFRRTTLDVANVNAADAKIYINHLKKAGLPYNEQLSVYYKKFSFPFILLISAFLAIGVTGKTRKNVLLISLSLSIVAVVLFYVFQMVTMVLAKTGVITPFMGAWLPDIVFLFIAGVLLKYSRT